MELVTPETHYYSNFYRNLTLKYRKSKHKFTFGSIALLAALTATQLNAFADGSCEKHKDENGDYYIYFPLSKMKDELGLSKSSAQKYMGELEENELILTTEHSGQQPRRIYISADTLSLAFEKIGKTK